MNRLPHPRFWLFLAVFAVATGAGAGVLAIERAVAVGFDLGALAFIAAALPLWAAGDAPALRSGAARDDGGRGLLLAVAVLVVGVILIAVGQMVAGGPPSVAAAALAVVTLVLAWAFANLVAAFHYAHLYYDPADDGSKADQGGLSFPGTPQPGFSDFCYFSFGVGMAFQVADVAVQAPGLRRVVTVHAVLAFLFNIGILAFTINILAGAS